MDISGPSPRTASRPAHRHAVVALCGLLLPNPSLAQAPPSQAVQAPSAPAPGSPLHEAILSPRKDLDPVYVEKAPPAALNERASIEPPSKSAVSIPGYWEWDPRTKDFLWVAGILREPPPGRFWANGYWKREDKGWYRVPGFWSDRPIGKIAWQEAGPPARHPEDEPGPSPGADHFYIPGRFLPVGTGVTWQKGFWAKAQPGWVWVPAQWVRQPEGWTVQEGFWDRPLEERGTRLALIQAGQAARLGDTAYRPTFEATPGQTVGRYVRPQVGPFGGAYDPSSRFTGNLGNLSPPGNLQAAPSGYFDQTLSVLNNNPGYSSSVSSGSGFGGYPYYGHGIGTSPGYYGGSSYGYGLGYYPGYYGGSGAESGKQGIEQGGLGGYPYYGRGLGYYPGYFGP